MTPTRDPIVRRSKTKTTNKSFCNTRKIVGGLLALLVLAVLPAPTHASSGPGTTERVSVASDGTEANFYSYASPAISTDGRYVAFESTASNLVPEDTSRRSDVFVRDRVTGTTERVSIASDGTEANQGSYLPAISSDGRYVAFSSYASNLVPGDTNGYYDVFVHDRTKGTTERVSVASDGTEANIYSTYPAISADGRSIAFRSYATNLVPGDTNGRADIFVHDRESGSTERVSVASDGTQSNAHSYLPSISADGSYIAFSTSASTLVPGDTNGQFDVFVRDRSAATTARVSVASDGGQSNAYSSIPAISANGRHVAFESTATNLVPTDTNGAEDVFIHDRTTGATERISVTPEGAEGNHHSGHPVMNADGRYVAFLSAASNLVPDDTNARTDVFVYARATGSTERASVSSIGAEANDYSIEPAISPDGRYVGFLSPASNLVPHDTNGFDDVFVHEQGGSQSAVSGLSVQDTPEGVDVSGRAKFSAASFAGAVDPTDDGTGVGPLGAADVGAELAGASLIYRPAQENLLIRLDLSALPSDPAGAGLPGILYGTEFRLGETRYEIRALRAGATSTTPRTPYVALYRCAPDCVEHAALTGSFGTTGSRVLVSVPLSVIGASEGTELSSLRAFTAAGEAAPGALLTLDEVALSSSAIPVPRVELGIAEDTAPEEEIAFTVAADLAAGDFSGTIPTEGLSTGSYRVWARACLGDACGAATSAPVTVGAPTEVQDTSLELSVAGSGRDMTLTARLTTHDSPPEAIAEKTIVFYSDRELIGSADTDESGIATVGIPPDHRGANRTYKAIFEGDDFYLGSSDERAGKGNREGQQR